MSVGLLFRGSECNQVCMHAGCDVVRFTMMISGNKIRPEGAKALAPSLGLLTQLTRLDLNGEQCNGCERKVLACMFVMFGVSGVNGSNCVCIPALTLLFVSP